MNTSQLHGKVIDHSQISSLPKRINFLNKKEVRKINTLISDGKTLLFQPASICEQDLPEIVSDSCDNNDVNSFTQYSKWYYKLILFGVFPDGRSATVVIEGIDPYIYVRIPSKYKTVTKRYKFKAKAEEMMRKDRGGFGNKKIDFEFIEMVKKKEFMGFNKSAYYLKITFSKASTSNSFRNRAIKLFNKNNLKTATDDISGYYKIPIRDRRLTISSWIELKKYSVIKKSKYFKDKIVYVVDIKNIKSCDEKTIHSNQSLARDKTMIMGWDIECASKSGDLPVPENPDDKMFMICLDFQWYYSKEQILLVNIVDHPIAPDPRFLSIVCHTERNIIKAFAFMFGIMTPEYVVGFNDTCFDWPWVVGRAWKYSKNHYDDNQQDISGGMKHSLIGYMAKKMDRYIHPPGHWYRINTFSKWLKSAKKDDDYPYYTGDKIKTDYNAYISSIVSNYKKEKVKIDASTYHYGYFLQYNGYIVFDARTIFRQLYPTAEKTSLNYFLNINNLKSKEDMEFQEMFRIYWRLDSLMKEEDPDKHQLDELKEKMREVAYYCIIDSQRCPELVKRRNVIPDKREVAKLTYSSIYDAFYRANGVKIRNMVFPILQERGYVASNLPQNKKDDNKFPGAKVLNPQTGLYTARLTLRERIEKFSEFTEEFGKDFNEPYSLRNLPYKRLMETNDIIKKIKCLEKAILQLGSPGMSLSRQEAVKVNKLAKEMYENS